MISWVIRNAKVLKMNMQLEAKLASICKISTVNYIPPDTSHLHLYGKK